MADNPAITLLGLGPGEPGLLTQHAWQVLTNIDELYLRTRHHPVVRFLPAGLNIHSFDKLYERADHFEQVYTEIVDQVLELAQRPQGVVYAVPGHPLVAEATGPEIIRRAKELGIGVRVVEAVSFIEPTLTALGIDPFPHMAFVDALELATSHVPAFPPSTPAIIAQLYSKAVASDVKLTLMEVYPDIHPVQLVHAAGTAQERVEHLALYEIDRSESIDLLTSLYVPALDISSSFEAFQEVIAHLRAPDGCPWDKEQTHQTLRPHLLEEAYELIDAIDANDTQGMREELGDLLLQIVLHAQIGSEVGEFTMAEILQGIHQKIVRRHPHVFGTLELDGIRNVLENWERLKEDERAANGKGEASLLDGVAGALPALVQAEEYQKRAARVGFDWDDVSGVREKVAEEWQEFESAPSIEEKIAEFGDLLFAFVNLSRWLDIDAESALRGANGRFRRRFHSIEASARAQGRSIADLTMEEMETLWQQAKDMQT